MTLRFALAFLLLPAVLAADTYPRQSGIDVLHYVFRLTLTDQSNEITGEATVTVKFLQDRVADMSLDLTSLGAGKGMTVQSVRRGHPTDMPGPAADAIIFTHTNNRLRLVLPPQGRAGQELTFTVRYRGVPGSGLRIADNMHGERTFFSENWPDNARQWLPMLDHPYDKATGEFIVTAPNHYQVVANGLLIEELDLPNNERRTHWKQAVPISSWLYALGVARFSFHSAGTTNGVPLQTWVFPQDREPGIRLFEDLSRRAMDFFVGHIGPYSYEKLANVEAAGLNGGTEHASAIFYGEKGVTNGNGPVVHEIAHQWWGNSVTERDWDDVWLSEGFATYFTLLFTEHDAGRDAFVAGLKQSRASVLQLEQKLPDTPVIHRNLSDMRRVLNGLVYQKAGWVLHMLRQEVGTERFWAAIRDYYRRYRNGHASTDDLRAVFEQHSGQSLEWFFAQWLNRPGVPKIEGGWRYDPVKKVVEVTVTQSQAAQPYRLKVGVGIAAKAGDLPRIETIELTGRQATRAFPLDAAPASVALDPQTTLLMDAGPFTRR
ncbi:MAG TPA: M1 family metallopeptidase [Vicinamibacterales bacterium]|nr:M1 family metallopeptidase [Vicinamibacterales bacterium]